MHRLLLSCIATCLVVAALGVPAVAFANMAGPYIAGDRVGEPSGDLKEIAIAHETLDLDLRPLDEDRPALVSATYDVHNDGSPKDLELLFVPVALDAHSSGAAGVWLDDQKVNSQVGRMQSLPASWQPPSVTPGLAGDPAMDYRVAYGSNQGITFSLHLPSGSHQIRVRYLARPSQVSGDSPVRYWQLGYVLAPARNWKSFGQLDVTVEVPTHWSLASSLPLQREGNVLRGTFQGIPADSLGLTTQAPVPPHPPVIDPAPFIFVVGLIGIAAIGWLAGGWLASRRRSSWMVLPLGVFAAIALAAAIFASLAVLRPESGVPDSQVAWAYGEGELRPVIAVFLALLALPTGIVATQLAAIFSHRRKSKALQ
jgi:hypothetical protein